MILQKLPIPKVFWNYMKNIYKQSNKASQVYFHKKLCHLIIDKNKDIHTFMKNWQYILKEATIAGCIFIESQ